MPDVPIQWSEPRSFRIGDSLTFQRSLPSWLPSAGWSIQYTLTPESPAAISGNAPSVSFTTVADATNNFHTVDIDDFGSGLVSGDYILTGTIVNGSERHQIYSAQLTLTDNLASGQNITPQTTHAQRMIPLLETKLEQLEAQSLQETDVNRTRFTLEQRKDDLERLKYYRELRAWELKT